jgi:hypothetical protein
MNPQINRPKVILITALVVLAIAATIWALFTLHPIAGWVVVGLIVVVLAVLGIMYLPPLFRWLRFQKTFKKYEGQLSQLPNLMMAGRTQQADLLFEEATKEAPESAYFYYMRAMFKKQAGKMPEALSAVNKAISMISTDAFLPVILQQAAGQPGQPGTVSEFRRMAEQLRDDLEPRVNAMRQVKEKAKKDRKKKSR